MSNMSNKVLRMSGASLLAGALVLSLAACGGERDRMADAASETQVVVSDTQQKTEETTGAAQAVSTSLAGMTTTGVIDTSDLFTERDLAQVADTAGATTITLASGQDVQITEEGVYVISGEASEATIVVDVDSSEKVQLVLDGASITNEDFPAIYVKSADKVFVTTTQGSTNTLQVTGSFVADGDTNTDAVIFSRDDLVLNGQGTLVVSSTGNGVSCKDDLKVTGGIYTISAEADALEANDAILVADGTLSITTNKDGLHAENDEDDTTGMVYVCGGSLNIKAADDGIHATTYLQVDDGTLTISAGEALEATYVQVNGGNVSIESTDDAVNASYKSASVGTPTIEVTGGKLSITMGQGDTDALDSNGNLVVSGGEIDISAQFAFDFDGTASFTGGTITVNGEQVSEISNSMMGGGMGRGGMGGDGGPMGGMGGGPRGGDWSGEGGSMQG